MKNRIRKIAGNVRGNYYSKTVFSSGFSLAAGCVFLAYNGAIGFLYGAVWNISICIYYAILSALRLNILILLRKVRMESEKTDRDQFKKIFTVMHTVLALLDISLVVPVAEMVMGNRDYKFGLIPAIAMAVYTTYRITAGIINFGKSRHSRNIFVLELRTLGMIDALLSVLTLQNALIIANGGFEGGIRTLVSWTSAGILVTVMGITADSYFTGMRFFRE